MLLGLLTRKEALRRLDDYIDRELSPEEMERVRRHLKICHACTRKFAAEQNFVREMRAKLDHLVLPPDLLRQVSAALTQADERGSPEVS
jgi:anti-sigma factor RsiW